MSQFGRPAVDTSRNSYVDKSGGTTNIYQSINEVSADGDASYILSPFQPANDTYICKLSTIRIPDSKDGHHVRMQVCTNGILSGNDFTMTVELRQGNPGSLIASWVKAVSLNELGPTQIGPPFTWVTLDLPLTAQQAALITDGGDLYLKIVALAT